MYKYSREFPIKIIPHVTELGEINDVIHNYKRPKAKEAPVAVSAPAEGETFPGRPKIDDPNKEEVEERPVKKQQKPQLALLQACPNITEAEVKDAINEITDDSTAKLVGLIGHLVYWSVFGHLSPLPLDKYHMKQLFISIS